MRKQPRGLRFEFCIIFASILVLAFVGITKANFAIFQVGKSSCWITGSDGWTVICATTITSGTCSAGTADGTCILAVKTGGSSGCARHDTMAAAIADACDTIARALTAQAANSRANKPDWILIHKGDTFDESNQITISGQSATKPLLFSSYDDANPTAPDPIVSSKVRPVLQSTAGGTTLYTGSAPGGDYTAIIGLKLYNNTHDPDNIGTTFGNVGGHDAGFALGNAHNWFLIEDCVIQFWADGINMDVPNGSQSLNTYIRRNLILDSWNAVGHASGIHAFQNNGVLLIEENVFDHDGFSETLANRLITATMTIASPTVVTANFGFTLINNMGMTFHDNGDTLPTGTTKGTAYCIIDVGTAGANTFHLSTDCTSGTIINTSGSQSGTHKIAWDSPNSAAGNSPTRSVQNQCIYLDVDNSPATAIKGNITVNCSGTGIQGRPSTSTVTGNFIARSLVCGFGQTVQNNVCSEGQEITVGAGTTGFAWTGQFCCFNGIGANNLISNKMTAGANPAFEIDNGTDFGHDHPVIITIANPAVVKFTNLVINNTIIQFNLAGGTIPSHIPTGTNLYVVNAATASVFDAGLGRWVYNVNLSLTSGGTPLSTLGDSAQSPADGTGQDTRYLSYNDTITGNTAYKWSASANFADATTNPASPGNSVTGNTDGGSFTGCSGSADNCTAGNYNATIVGCASMPGGCTATFDAWMTNVRAQSKSNWNNALMARAVNAWIGAGFGMTFP